MTDKGSSKTNLYSRPFHCRHSQLLSVATIPITVFIVNMLSGVSSPTVNSVRARVTVAVDGLGAWDFYSEEEPLHFF